MTCSIGVGTSKTVAKIASDMDKPRGLTVVFPGSERDFLAPLPVRTMSGIGAAAEEKLRARGIRTLGQLADAGEEASWCGCSARTGARHARARARRRRRPRGGRRRGEVRLERDDLRGGPDHPRGRGGGAGHHRGEGGAAPEAQGAGRAHAVSVRVRFSRPQRALRAAPAGRVPPTTSWPTLRILYRMVREALASGHAGAASGRGDERLCGRAAAVQESLFRRGGGGPLARRTWSRSSPTRASAAASSPPPTP